MRLSAILLALLPSADTRKTNYWLFAATFHDCMESYYMRKIYNTIISSSLVKQLLTRFLAAEQYNTQIYLYTE